MMAMQFKRFVAVWLVMMLMVSYVSVFNATEVYAVDDNVIHFPDANLKKALIARGLDLNRDGEITRGEMASYGIGEQFATLDLTKQGITNISGIEYAVNIKYLILNGNSIDDLIPLKEMNQLECLTVGNTNVNDISPLANLTNIRFLDLNRTKVRDIGPVATSFL